MANDNIDGTSETPESYIYIYQIKCIDCRKFKEPRDCGYNQKKRFCEAWVPFDLPEDCYGNYRENGGVPKEKCNICGYREWCMTLTKHPLSAPVEIMNIKRIIDNIGQIDPFGHKDEYNAPWRWLIG